MATTDPALIASWWVNVPFNIALELRGVVAVDVDNDDALEALQTYGPWPVTPTQQTGRGWHMFFRVPVGFFPTLSNIDGLPIETKGEGASLTLAPSRHANGNTYRFVSNRDPFTCPLAPLPERFLSHVRRIALTREVYRKTHRTVVDVSDVNAVAALIQQRSERATQSSNGLGRGVYGLKCTLAENGADDRTLAAAERAWWHYHGHEVRT